MLLLIDMTKHKFTDRNVDLIFLKKWKHEIAQYETNFGVEHSIDFKLTESKLEMITDFLRGDLAAVYLS